MHMLLTGFNPFGERAINPSQIIVQTLSGQTPGAFQLTGDVLRTEFAYAGARIRALIHELRPDAVVMLGLAANRNTISLERVALNLDDATIPDNAGDCADGRLIAPDGPAAYWSTLPLNDMRMALRSHNIPVSISNHAGAFVCNHVFYCARHAIEQAALPARCGFIHVPLMAEQVENDTNALPLAVLLDGIKICLNILAATSDESDSF